ncbi:MAG TPA: SGNH/GDSL hydrolase family protein [Gemmatimonadales bacterium]|nr:SGNH/GDSL hydrolase family protein [Gemmatimonadales bacterium]
MTIRRMSLAAALGLALIAVGCHNDELFSPVVPAYTGGAMFVRYVAMGNSITAGFQSGGINDSTQKQSYARLVANQMGSTYYYPKLVMPGCPPPFTNIFTNTRVAGGTATTCYYRNDTIPPFLSNVAVPGAEVMDILHNGPTPGTSSNALTQLFLGGRTQIQAMMAARPTFVSVWIGNNDVLGAALAQDISLLTPVPAFTASYTEVVDSIEAAGAKAVLIGIGEGSLLPYFSTGSTYFALKQGGVAFPPTFAVDSASCATPRGDTVLVAFPVGAALINAALVSPDTLNCANPAQAIQPADVIALQTAIVTFNTIIASQATAHGWAYTDFNFQFDSLRGLGQVAAFPNLGAACSTSPFGTAFSCDGIHPSAASSKMMARRLVQVINTKYNSTIPTIP